MDTTQPAPSVPSAPLGPVYDGESHFGSWTIPGIAGWQTMVLEGDRFSGGIRGTIDGNLVTTCPWPLGKRTTTSSSPWSVDGHQIVVYAESWDLGQTVRCDVFVDGRSLSTGEPISVISRRKAAVGRFRSQVSERWSGGVRRARAEGLVTFITLFEGAFLGHSRIFLSNAVAFAVVLGGNLAILEAGTYGDRSLRSRGGSPLLVMAIEAALIVSCLAVAVLVFALAALVALGRP